jgi:hypothetical protein
LRQIFAVGGSEGGSRNEGALQCAEVVEYSLVVALR